MTPHLPTDAPDQAAAVAQGQLPGTERAGEGQLGPTGRPLPAFPEPQPLTAHGPARVIAMCNQKGGVGKTTSTINLGAAFAELGRRVLLVDFDPQGALSVGLGINPNELDVTVYNLLMDRSTDVRSVIRSTNVERLDVLPANIDLSAAEVQLVSEVAREQVLSRVLRPVTDVDEAQLRRLMRLVCHERVHSPGWADQGHAVGEPPSPDHRSHRPRWLRG